MISSKDFFSLRRPCAKCPFRKDVGPYLTRGRIMEIIRSLTRVSFFCHETTHDLDDDEDYYNANGNEKHCAGALILCEKENAPGQMMRIGERLGLYDRFKLDMTAPVYDSFKQMIQAHMNERRNKKTVKDLNDERNRSS